MKIRMTNPLGAVLLLGVFLCPYSFAQDAKPAEKPSEAPEAKAVESAEEKQKRLLAEGWKMLLPEKGLGDWESSDFFSPGKVARDGEAVILEMGEPLTGITYTKKDFPKTNFEISLEAKRVEGGDFLCGLTFPVDEGFCSLIAGGWGGGVVGLSSIDGADASENETTTYQEFENGKWYQIRLTVEEKEIRVWIDDQEFFRLERYGQEFSTRIEVEASKPLGYCAFQSKVAIRDFRWRPIQSEGEDPTDGKGAEKAEDD